MSSDYTYYESKRVHNDYDSENSSDEIEVRSPFAMKIEEDSSLRKVIACVPLIGVVSTLLNERSLVHKISNNHEPNTLVKLIEVKNDYKKGAIVRELLLAAVFATLLIIGIIRGHTVSQHIARGLAIGVLSGLAILHGYRISHNNKMIDAIEKGEMQGHQFEVK